jgi:AraC-like DNA-binding protein
MSARTVQLFASELVAVDRIDHPARLSGQPSEYLIARRLEAAAVRLRDAASITETSAAVGFGNLSHFIHAFRAAYHVTPSTYRAAHRGACRS